MPIHNFLAKHPVLRYRFILEIWKLAKLQRWAVRHPLLGPRFKPQLDISPEENEAIIIPVQKVLRGGENTVLPYQILASIVEKADGHMLLGRCPCRDAENCAVHPHDFGCLFLGSAVAEVSPKIGTQTNVEGAMRHVSQAIAMGLVPMIIHASFDAALVSLPYEKMLAICFCCDCCCTIRHQMRLGPSTFDDTIRRLPGLTVAISQDCIACGDCHSACPVKAIHYQDGISVIDQERCKGCGLCAATCPQGAPRLYLDDSTDVVQRLVDRIRARTEIGL